MAKDKTPKLSEEELQDHLRAANEAEAEFAESHRYVREDGIEGADAWVASARSYLNASSSPEPFASRSVDLSRDRIAEFVCAWALGSGEFQRWLHERVNGAQLTGGSGYCNLSRKHRDQELERLHAEVTDLEQQIEHRRLTAERERLEAELAAITGSCA